MKTKNIIGYIIGIFICCLAFFFIKEFIKEDSESKEYSKDGFSIVLDGDFALKEKEGIDIYYESLTSFVAVLKEDFKTLEQIKLDENSTLDEYGAAVLKNNSMNKELLDLEDGKYKYFEYDSTVGDQQFYYIGVITKGSDGFYLINFCSEYKNKDEFQPKFLKWAKTIKVN